MSLKGLIFLAFVLVACGRPPAPIGLPRLEADNPNSPDQTLPVLPAAQVEPNAVRPASVIVDPQAIYVIMEDGAQCLGSAGDQFSAAGWTGTLQECPYEYAYSVELSAGAVAQRALLQPVVDDGLPDPDDAPPFRPVVSVMITSSAGARFWFESIEGF